jgi:hypothetical protein
MDETALLAMGILLEEMAKESLGETGDLVLVEVAEDIDVSEGDSVPSQGDNSNRRKRSSTNRSTVHAIFREESRTVRRKASRKRKKVRLDNSAPETTEGEADADEA